MTKRGGTELLMSTERRGSNGPQTYHEAYQGGRRRIGVRRPTAELRHAELREFGQRLLPRLLLDVQRQASGQPAGATVMDTARTHNPNRWREWRNRARLARGGLLMRFIAKVMTCGFVTFYSMPEAVPFLVRLTMMVVTQVALGKALQREEQR